MKNIKLKVKFKNTGDTIVITCHELACDARSVSAQIDTSAVDNLSFNLLYGLEYEYDDLAVKCDNAKIVKYQIDDENHGKSFVKFAYEKSVVNKSKYKILKDTVENLMNTSESRLICLNLDRRAGHSSTLLWLMDKNPNAILVVKTHQLKQGAMELSRDLQYNISKKNIVVMHEGANIPSLFEGSKFDMILIDDFSQFSKNCIEKIFYHTRNENGDNVRYVCLG